MPNKKKAKKKTVTHHRKVGALKTQQADALQMTAGAALGAAGGWYVYTTQKTIKDELMGLLQLGVGVGLLMFTKMPLLQGVGLGLAGAAGIIEGESFGFLSGVTNLPNSNNLKIAGYGDVHQLGAIPGGANIPGGTFPSPGAVGRMNMATRYAGVYNR